MGTRATISIKRANDAVYNTLWYVHYDGYLSQLGREIFDNLKTVNDIERCPVIFKREECSSIVEIEYRETKNIQDILNQWNDYSYIFLEVFNVWIYYKYNEKIEFDLETNLKNLEEGLGEKPIFVKQYNVTLTCPPQYIEFEQVIRLEDMVEKKGVE